MGAVHHLVLLQNVSQSTKIEVFPQFEETLHLYEFTESREAPSDTFTAAGGR
jgi:hypothetical protein